MGRVLSCAERDDRTKLITLESFVLDEFLLPIHNAEEPFRIPCRNVSCLEPPVGSDCFSGRGLVIEVSLQVDVRKEVPRTLSNIYLHHVRAAKPKFTSRIFTLWHVISVIIYKPSLHVRNETTDRTDIREPFSGEHCKSTSGDFRHPIG